MILESALHKFFGGAKHKRGGFGAVPAVVTVVCSNYNRLSERVEALLNHKVGGIFPSLVIVPFAIALKILIGLGGNHKVHLGLCLVYAVGEILNLRRFEHLNPV